MADSNFQQAHRFTAFWEGGLSDDPADHGGVTKYGVSLAFLADLAKNGDGLQYLSALALRPLPPTKTTVVHLTKTQAEALFRREFWDRLKLDSLPFSMAALLYDAAVNCGCTQSVKLAQRGYNRCVGYGVPLAVDGILGPKTRKALAATVTTPVVTACLEARRTFYRQLVRNKPDQEVFLRGWLNRTDSLETFLLHGRLPEGA